MNESRYKIDIKNRCYKFSLKIIEMADLLPKKRSAWIIEDQVVRSATSIGANLIEAKASSSRLEFKKFNEIALKSANETIYWLGLLKDSKFIEPTIIESLMDEVIQISKMLASGIMKLKNS